MLITLKIVGFIHTVLFFLVSINIHEDGFVSSSRKNFAYVIAFFLPVFGPIISYFLVERLILEKNKNDGSSYDGDNYTSEIGSGDD